MRKIVPVAVLVLSALLFLQLPAFAAPIVWTETQFTYSQSNPAWLKDLGVKEDMLSPTQLANSVKLKALPEYPYSKTPEGFRSEVEYYTELFSLNENSQRAAYIYVLRYINQFATEATRNVSDEYIKNSLTSMGIVYPQGGMGDYENLIFARSLYTLLCSGAVTLDVTPGMTVQEALVKCLTQTLHISDEDLTVWSTSAVLTLDDYVLVSCKIALNSAGYSVRADTPSEEVYRLTAVMMIRELGISIDEDTADFEELKIKYLAALLGERYDVSISPSELRTAKANGNVPFYILQLIGREYGLTVRNDMSFSEAFNLVASNSDRFRLEEGEFYADIYQYAAYLDHKRDRIWVSPLAYRTTTATEVVTIEVNGEPCASGAWAEVALDKTQSSQDVTVFVRFVSPSQDTSQTYTITVYQGRYEASGGSAAPATTDANSNFPATTNASTDPEVVGKAALDSLTGTLSSAAVKANIPARLNNIFTLMSPSAGTASANTAAPAAQSGTVTATSGVSTAAPAASAGVNADYLSQLMGGSTGVVRSAAAQSVPSVTAGVTSKPPVFTTVPASTAAAAPSGTGDRPMLASQAGQPPEGYEYLVNGEGYITGIALKKNYAAPASPTYQEIASPSPVRAPLKRALPAIAVGCVAALCGVAMIVMKVKKGRV